MISPLDIVLVAVVIVKTDFGNYQLEYQPLDYYTSMNTCVAERNKLQKKNETKGLTYICLKVDRN